MFWIMTLFVMIIAAITLVGVADMIEHEEMEDEYEIAYVIV